MRYQKKLSSVTARVWRSRKCFDRGHNSQMEGKVQPEAYTVHVAKRGAIQLPDSDMTCVNLRLTNPPNCSVASGVRGENPTFASTGKCLVDISDLVSYETTAN